MGEVMNVNQSHLLAPVERVGAPAVPQSIVVVVFVEFADQLAVRPPVASWQTFNASLSPFSVFVITIVVFVPSVTICRAAVEKSITVFPLFAVGLIDITYLIWPFTRSFAKPALVVVATETVPPTVRLFDCASVVPESVSVEVPFSLPSEPQKAKLLAETAEDVLTVPPALPHEPTETTP